MVHRPRTLGTLFLCLWGSLSLIGCDSGSWESDAAHDRSSLQVGQAPSFAPGERGSSSHRPEAPSDGSTPQAPGSSGSGTGSPPADDERSDGAEDSQDGPAPVFQTPPREEKPSEDETWAPAPPQEESEEEEEPSSSSSQVIGDPTGPEVSLSLQSVAQAGTPLLMSAQAKGAVQTVVYEVDAGVVIGSGQGANHELQYTFWSVGVRPITVRGYDGAGGAVAVDSGMLMVLPSGDDSEAGSDPPPSSPPPADPSPSCPAGEISDCVGACFDACWVGDGICDDGSNTVVNFMCDQLQMDGGDCDAGGSPGCPSGQQKDCNGLCVKTQWIGDGFCDDGSQYNVDLDCAAFNFDEGDCGTVSPGSSGPSGSTGADVSQLPYFYQYYNSLYPGASCQNTSIAMVLAHYGWSGTPDDITSTFGKNLAQSPSGLAQVFNHYAENLGIPERIVPHTNGSIGGLQGLLAKGKPVIVHGYFTSAGHVLVATAYSGSGYTVNDPAGKWAQSWQGGYPFPGGSQAGKQLTYGSAAFELAISSTNGSNYAPLWYHEITE